MVTTEKLAIDSKRLDLMELTKSYLQAAGYEVTRRARDFLVARRTTIGQEEDVFLVWLPSITGRTPFTSQEGPYYARFQQATEEFPTAKKTMIVPSFEGISAEFRSEAKRVYNVNIRVPIQFFDAPFKAEEAAETSSSAIRELRSRGDQILRRRVAQPYRDPGSEAAGEDLLDFLYAELRRPRGLANQVKLIVGPAGMGKTFLFEALFSRLYAGFLQDKNSGIVSPRPFPLIPQYVRGSDTQTIKGVIRAFLGTDFTRTVEEAVFEWMITNGFAVWLLDGLDEVIGRDDEFFLYLLHLLTAPGARGQIQIVICVRDSLLATNAELRDFLEDSHEVVQIYELAKWSVAAKRQFATSVLGSEAEVFINGIQQRPSLAELSSTPYYCELLVDQYRAGQFRESYTEADLIGDALSAILNREYEKGLLDRNLVPVKEVTEFLEVVASDDLERDFRGVDPEVINELAQIMLPYDLGLEERRTFIVHLMQLSVFTRGSGGTVRFTQEILEHFLLGQYLSQLLSTNEAAFSPRMSVRQIPPDWITMKVLAQHVRARAKLDRIVDLALGASSDTAFRNIVQLAALAATDSPTALKRIPFERTDLSGVVFSGLDFRGVSFRGGNLTDVDFRESDLREANFDQAIIKNTGFLVKDPDALRGAKFGDLTRFYSLRNEHGRTLSDYGALENWIRERTGIRPVIAEPCPAARQLRYLFGKFVHPDGEPRRATLDRKGVLAGKSFHNANDVLEAAVRQGYLVEQKFRDRVSRAEGSQYSEMVEFVKGFALTQGLRDLLSSVCPNPNCVHVPESA